MVEVVLTNLQRIDQLWPIFLSHVMELLSHPKTSIRNAAVDALAKAVLGALSHVSALADAGQDKVRLITRPTYTQTYTNLCLSQTWHGFSGKRRSCAGNLSTLDCGDDTDPKQVQSLAG